VKCLYLSPFELPFIGLRTAAPKQHAIPKLLPLMPTPETERQAVLPYSR
jgi:hypothetical protein